MFGIRERPMAPISKMRLAKAIRTHSSRPTSSRLRRSLRIVRIAVLATVIGAGVSTSLVAAAAATAMPVVEVPNVTGQKLKDAQAAIAGAGMSSFIQTVLGGRTDLPDCTVTRQQVKHIPALQDTLEQGSIQILLSLSCNAPVATTTSPGNSPESPAGQAALAAAAASAPSAPSRN